MSFQSSSHFDSTTLLIVKTEIDNTIKNVENGVTSLIEDGALPFGIDDALTSLEQCAHVLNLVDQAYAAKLTSLIAKVMQKVMQDTQNHQAKESDVEAMSEATTTVKRYLDFLCLRETRAPQFLVSTINKLEIVLNLPLTREGTFLTSFLETIQPNVQFDELDNFPASAYVSRLYKLSLLNILQNKATELDFSALALCANYLAVQAIGLKSEQFWRFVHLAFKNLNQIKLTDPRLRVLINIERHSLEFLNAAQSFAPNHEDYADILALCLTQDSDISHQIREQLSIHDDILSDNQLNVLSRQLYGPDLNTIQAVVKLLSTQIADVSSKIEMGQHIQSQDIRENIYTNLCEVSKILDVINLNDAAQQLLQQAEQILENRNLNNEQQANQLMNTLLFTTNSLQILEYSYTPTRLKFKFNNTNITLEKVEEAQKLLCNEARISLQQISDYIIQYAQSQNVTELQPLPELLREVSGALLFLESTQCYNILQKAGNIIEHLVLANQKTLSIEQLKLLANAISSADFYLEQLQNKQPFISQTIQVGEQSVNRLALAVA